MVAAAVRIQQEFNPEWLVVETTGIAYPKKIQDNLLIALQIPSRIGVLVDASRWNRLLIPMNALLQGQIIGSDAVLINKVDLVEDAVVDKAEQDIRGFDGETAVFRISAMQEVPGAVWKQVLGL